jgi:hypothetical protein
MSRNPAYILGRMLTHIEVLERAHGHASVGALRRLHDELKASFLEDDLRASIAMVKTENIVPFPQDVRLRHETASIIEASQCEQTGTPEGAA